MGGRKRIRTAVAAFAELSLATRPSDHFGTANVEKFCFFTTKIEKMSDNFLTPIAESELIVTPKGHIYHLDLPQGVLPGTVFTVGDPDRVGEVSKYFDKVTHKAQHREFVTHIGTIGNQGVACISTGIGPDNIDIVMNELDALVNVDFKTRCVREQKTALNIIRLGTCGGLQPDVPVDSFIVSSHGIGLDNLLHFYKPVYNPDESFILGSFVRHTKLESGLIQPYIAESAVSLRKYFINGYVHGITVTCPGFYGPQGRVLRGKIAYPGLIDSLTGFRYQDLRVTNFEMETSALYGLGRILGHKCLSISTIVANRAAKTFSKDAGKSVDTMIKKSLDAMFG